MDTIAPSFIIVSSSNLQDTSKAIKSQTSSNFGHIHPLTLELPALEHRKKCCGNHSTFSFDWIFFKLADKEDRHKILEEFHLGQSGLFVLELHALERRKFSP